MARAMFATGVQPSEYKALTLLEREELIKVVERVDKQRRKG
jgi:hypothetical protein